MEIKFKQENQGLQAAPEGRIDASTAPDFQKQLTEALDGVRDFTLDLAGSADISVLLLSAVTVRTAADRGKDGAACFIRFGDC